MNPNAWPWLFIFGALALLAVCGLLLRIVRHDKAQDERDEAEIAELMDRSAFLTSVYGVELDDEPATVKESLPVGVVKQSLTTDAFTLRSNWDEAPEWAMCRIQQPWGSVMYYERQPVLGMQWHYEGGRYHFDGCGPANPNWKQAIEQRPAKVGYYEPLPVPTPEEVQRVADHTWRLAEAISTERDDNDLIPRARHRQLIAIESAAEKYVKNYRSTDNFEKLAEAVRVKL